MNRIPIVMFILASCRRVAAPIEPWDVLISHNERGFGMPNCDLQRCPGPQFLFITGVL